MMRKAVESRRWSMTLPRRQRRVVKGKGKMEEAEKSKVDRPGVQEKKGRRGSRHTAEKKCQAVLSVWTKRRKPGDVCRELGITWSVLNQWQERAMEGMLLALQPRVAVDKAVALNSRLAVLLERRLSRLQGIPEDKQGDLMEAAAEKKV